MTRVIVFPRANMCSSKMFFLFQRIMLKAVLNYFEMNLLRKKVIIEYNLHSREQSITVKYIFLTTLFSWIEPRTFKIEHLI